MGRWKISTLDVWGNEEEGFDVNDFFYWKTIDASELDDEKAFFTEYLIGDPDQYEMNDYGTEGWIEVSYKATGKPILHLNKIFDGEE